MSTPLTCGEIIVTVSKAETEVTVPEIPLTIVFVRYQTELLTKRRAVDYCRVKTALCLAA
jgi:hypothetical protein